MKKQLFSAAGSFIRAFLAALIALSIAHKSPFEINLVEILWSALASTAPVLINFLNPKDSRYGLRS